MSNPTGTADADLELVLAGYAAYARGDIVTAVAALHPDIEWVASGALSDGGAHRGRAAVAAHLRSSRDAWFELRSMPLARRVGDRIVVEHHVRGTLADGTARQATVAEVFTVRDGQVVHTRAYADPADVPAPVPG